MLSWVLSLLWLLVPRSSYRDTYADTASAIAAESARAPLFEGPHGAEQTAALLVSLAFFESSLSPYAVGDHGKSVGLYQLHATAFRLAGVHSRREILGDPANATHVALEMLRTSLRECRRLPPDERLGWYTAGNCERGRLTSRHRVQFAKRLLRDHPAPNGGDS